MASEPSGFDVLRSAEAYLKRRTGRRVNLQKPARKSRLDQVNRAVMSFSNVGLFVLGLAAIAYAFFMMYKPAGVLVAGVLAVTVSLLLSPDTDEPGKQSS